MEQKVMVHPLIGVHAAIGELGVLAFLWVFIELMNPSVKGIARCRKAAILGVVCFLTVWITGGFYYVVHYGPNVKPLILAGPQPWAHKIVMEAKEHIFLFLPFLAVSALGLISSLGNSLIKDKRSRRTVQWLSAMCVIIGMAMALMGYMISTAARLSLELGVKP